MSGPSSAGAPAQQSSPSRPAPPFRPAPPGAGARSEGLSYQQLLDGDTRPVPEVLRCQSARELPVVRVPVERYVSRAFHDLEVERLWKRVWQFACREEEIPEPGDHTLYEIAAGADSQQRRRERHPTHKEATTDVQIDRLEQGARDPLARGAARGLGLSRPEPEIHLGGPGVAGARSGEPIAGPHDRDTIEPHRVR